MQMRTRMCMCLDGYVTTPQGWPAQLADRSWSPERFGFVEFQAGLDAVLMGDEARRHRAERSRRC